MTLHRILGKRLGSGGCALAILSSAWAGTLTGKLVAPTTGPIANGTLSLTLSQAAVEPGSFAIAPQEMSCYTAADGSVVGIPNPLAAPSGGAFPGVGTLPGGTYYVEISYSGPGGTESAASSELRLQLGAAGRLQIAAPALQPAAATGYYIYIGLAPGAETRQGGSSLNSPYVQSSALGSGAAPTSSNSTVCGLVFNDSVIPAYTYYSASLSDANGNVLPGYPQNWYLSGGTVDVSTIIPLASNPAVRFPSPILSNPSSTAAQSVGSPLNLNGFGIAGSANVGPGFFNGYWSGSLPAADTALAAWTPNAGIVLRRVDVNAQTAGAGGTAGTTITVSDGTSTCSFSGLLVAGAASTSGLPTGACQFGAGIPLTVRIAGDDHTAAPGNIGWAIEMTSR